MGLFFFSLLVVVVVGFFVIGICLLCSRVSDDDFVGFIVTFY